MSGKGGSFEREICKDLSKWIQGTEKPYIFWRGRGSGGTFTTSHLVGEDFAGDVYAVRDEGRFFTNIFSIELKTGYKESSLDKFLKYNKSDPIKDFWEQCTTDAQKSAKLPLLIYQKKGIQPKWVGINYVAQNVLSDYLKLCRFVHLYWAEDLYDTWFYSYDDFFAAITPDIIKKEFST